MSAYRITLTFEFDNNGNNEISKEISEKGIRLVEKDIALSFNEPEYKSIKCKIKKLLQGYNSFKTNFFKVEESPEVLKWRLLGRDQHDTKRAYMMNMLKESYGYDVVSYEVRIIPREKRRSVCDSAKLLIIKTVDGSQFAKRYNNNQKFKIEL